MNITAYDLAQRFIGIKEVAGTVANPQIMAMLKLDASWPEDDSVPWCSAFVSYICWLLRLPRSKSLRARSWLSVGEPINELSAVAGYDIVVLRRGKDSPGPEVIDAPGHVGFFSYIAHEHGKSSVYILGGNQSDSVSLGIYDAKSIIGVRRLYKDNKA